MRIEMPALMTAALPVLERLCESGYEAVFVGGCVRDTLLGRTITDVDIATSARPAEVTRLFERTVPTGIQHGTVTVLLGDDSYEVTTYREESAYENHRKPESVAFISELEGDLLRRDLTINAIALRADGLIIDPYGGCGDLRDGVIRCVGDADARFQEDALRMLRAIRFTAEFGFECSPETWSALIRHRSLLRHIAMERVRMELDKMISGSSPLTALELLGQSRLLDYVKDPLEAWPAIGHAIHNGTIDIAAALDGLDSPELRWAFLFMRAEAQPEAAGRMLDALKFSGSRRDIIVQLLQLHWEMKQAFDLLPWKDGRGGQTNERIRIVWTQQIIRLGLSAADGWLNIVTTASMSPYHEAAEWLESCRRSIPVASLRDLSLNGRELAEHMRLKPGPWTGEWLGRLLLETALGRIANNRDELLALADKWKAEEGSS